MKSVVAILLIVVGVAALAYQGFTYTTQEKAVDVGPLHVTKEQQHSVPIPPVIGGVAIAGGIVLLLLGRKGS